MTPSSPPKLHFLAAFLAGLVVWAGMPAGGWAQSDEPGRDAEQNDTTETPDQPEGRAPVEQESPSTPGYETADVGDEDFLSLEHRRQLYREGRLDYGRAALWTALFPGFGNFYAEQYFLGGLFASLMGFAGFFLAYGLVTRQPGFNWAAVGLAGASYAGGFSTSYIGVRNYNRRLRRSLRIEEASASLPRPRFRGVTLSFRF